MEWIKPPFQLPSYSGVWLAIALVGGFSLVGAVFFGRRELAGREAAKSSAASLAFLVVNSMLGVWIAAMAGLMVALYAKLGLPRVAADAWVGLPFWFATFLGVLMIDTKNYAAHRWLHGRIGWPVHAIHHSDPHVNGLTAYRVHALELVVMRFFGILLFGWVGTPPAVAASATFVLLLYDLYVHSDTDIEHGWLRYIFASPRFHRWHHYDNPAAYTTNLAGVFSFLDVLFGTYHEPKRLPDPLGAATAGVPANDVVKLLLFPFAEWGRMIREKLQRPVKA
jgi:sterol desaturase/sphingolipid hydroxylase (fatty acid hydroxylase superfamily)